MKKNAITLAATLAFFVFTTSSWPLVRGTSLKAITALAMGLALFLIGWYALRWLRRAHTIGPVELTVPATPLQRLRFVLAPILLALALYTVANAFRAHTPVEGVEWRSAIVVLGFAVAAWVLLAPTQLGIGGLTYGGLIIPWTEVADRSFDPETSVLTLTAHPGTIAWRQILLPIPPVQSAALNRLWERASSLD